MKRLILAVAILAAPAAAAVQQVWASVARPAPQGSYVIGNPAAKVKLIEYVSYTCPHCGQFTRESAPVLKDRMIASGSLSLEVRNSVHDRYDLAAATLARCSGPALFPKVHEAFYARQEEWLAKAMAFDPVGGQNPAGNTQAEKLRTLADGAGLTAIAKSVGMGEPAIRACFASDAAVNQTLKVAQAMSGKIRGTPSFELDGKLIERVDWAKLEPILRAAGAK